MMNDIVDHLEESKAGKDDKPKRFNDSPESKNRLHGGKGRGGYRDVAGLSEDEG